MEWDWHTLYINIQIINAIKENYRNLYKDIKVLVLLKNIRRILNTILKAVTDIKT